MLAAGRMGSTKAGWQDQGRTAVRLSSFAAVEKGSLGCSQSLGKSGRTWLSTGKMQPHSLDSGSASALRRSAELSVGVAPRTEGSHCGTLKVRPSLLGGIMPQAGVT